MNFNQERALAILNIKKPVDNCERLEFGYPELKSLVLLGLVDLDDTQNDSPTVGQFLEFYEKNRCGEEEIIFEGYIVTDRADSRVSVEGIKLHTELASQKVQKEFIEVFRLADEFTIGDSMIRAWWD